MANATFTVTVTDANGCTTSRTSFVASEDARCFAGNSGNSKVKLGHQTGISTDKCHELCVAESAVPAHLVHGDFIGSCTPNCIAPVNTYGVAHNPDNTAEAIQNKGTLNSADGYFRIKAMPNPSATDFTLLIKSPKQDKVKMRVTDLLGRVIEVKPDIAPNGTIHLGSKYFPGTYIVEIMQGNEKRVVKLFKLRR